MRKGFLSFLQVQSIQFPQLPVLHVFQLRDRTMGCLRAWTEGLFFGFLGASTAKSWNLGRKHSRNLMKSLDFVAKTVKRHDGKPYNGHLGGARSWTELTYWTRCRTAAWSTWEIIPGKHDKWDNPKHGFMACVGFIEIYPRNLLG